MNAMLLPPGFRFHPTDEELVGYYLKRKIDGLKIELEVIPVIHLCKFDPWELPDKSFLPKRDMEWFFFCPRDRKYPNGSRTNRATVSGYWKATGKDRKISCESSVFGSRKTLVFYLGRAPGGERTDWIMHEYRLCEDLFQGSSNFLGAFALCRVVKRSGNWVKASDPHGEPRAKRCSKRNFDAASHGREESSSLDLIDSSCNASDLPSPETVIALGEPHVISDASKADGGASMREAFTVDEPGNAFFSSFPSPARCMGTCSCSWEDITSHSLRWDATTYIDASYGTEDFGAAVSAHICRQASEGEEANLWLQEDNIVTVM
ncbi:No apical meristem (NAM) protein [Musa troglodytarum]|uniref:No apical meristem (NAM) protein n=1 Tax=Musa troglodytarum TaxID=320322 RepID=A0A9E7FQH7_9LILI|nr:No apical meristem (NAM) protein [Musa troglodytarum]